MAKMNRMLRITVFCTLWILGSPAVPNSVPSSPSSTSTPTQAAPDLAQLVCPTGEAWCSNLDDNRKLELEAIRCLHRQLDDDQDGNINLDESDEFLRVELKYEKDYEKRQKAFHRNNDNQVTVRELWETWLKSEVHNWTVEQTVEWLSIFVGLPQYQHIFTQLSVNGTSLPRLAVNHKQYLSSTIGIKDMIHRQKISLKAQDVVLFGPPKEYSNYVKDIFLTTLSIVASVICWVVYARYKSSQRELNKLLQDMEVLAKAEKEFETIMEKNKSDSEEFEKAMKKDISNKSLTDLEVPDEEMRDEFSRLRGEVEVLRSELQRAEVELQDKCWVPPPALQHWLQLTYELELKGYNKKKVSAERQLRQAKDACDKLKKKRSSLMGAFVSTHGKSIDDVDKAILEAKTSLTEITHELQERMHRWKQIEMLVNCPIVNNPGLHYLETVLRGYGKSTSYPGPGSVISNSQDDIEDDAASSIYCPSAVHKLVSSSAFLMFPGGGSSNASVSSGLPSTFRLCQFSPQSGLGGSSIGGGGGNFYLSPVSLFENSAPSNQLESKEKDVRISSPTSSSPANRQTSPGNQTSQSLVSSYSICDNALSSTSSTESDDTVSAPATTNLHLPIARSKSVSSMLSLRERASRELALANRDSSTAEEDNMPGEASEMVAMNRTERDRRVTFGLKSENRNGKVKSESESPIVAKSGQTLATSPNGDTNGREIEPSCFLKTNMENCLNNLKSEREDGDPGKKTSNGFSPEKPDLIKLSEFNHTQKEDSPMAQSLPHSPLDSSLDPITAQNVVIRKRRFFNTSFRKSWRMSNVSHLGNESQEENLQIPANVTLDKQEINQKEKTGMWKAVSKFVTHGGETLKLQKNYKIHAAEADKKNITPIGERVQLVSENGGGALNLSNQKHKSNNFFGSLKRKTYK